jgi:replicative superfamily II helicase
MNTKWTNKITNKELLRITKQKPIEFQIKIRKWNWIGHTLRKEAGAIEKTALDWNPQGYRRRGRPKRTWRRTTEDEIRNTGRSWNEVKGIAGDGNAWKVFMDVLCSTRSKRN